MDKIDSKDLLQAFKHPALILNVSNIVVAANKTFQDFVGLTEEDILGSKSFKLIHGNECDAEPKNCLVKKIMNGDIRDSVECESKIFDGYSIVSCTPIFDGNGKLKRIIHVTTDITGIKNAENALKSSERKYRKLVDNAMVGVFTSSLDGDIKFANNAMVEMFGYDSVEDLKEHHIAALYKNRKDREIFLDDLNENGVLMDYEVETVNKNGGHMNVLVCATLNKDELSGMFMDITDRKKSEIKLMDSEERYRTLYSSMSEGVAIHKIVYSKEMVPVDYTIVDVNPAFEKILGITREESVGKNASEVYSLEKPPYLEIYANVGKTGHPTRFETYYEPIDKYFDISVFSLSKDTFVTVFEDISSHRKSEDDIRASLKEKEILLQEIHHRVKNNMQIISSLLNLQKRYVDGDEVALDVLKESQNRVTSMAMIHEKLYQSNDFMHINIGNYVENLVTDLFYSYAIPKSKIIPIVDSDEIQLNIETSIPCGLIISELVSNSLKYAFPNERTGEIRLSIKVEDDGYHLTVSDNGIGLPENFDFKNTESLGLELVNNLVDQIDGTIKLDSSSGTKFNIKFQELEYKKRI